MALLGQQKERELRKKKKLDPRYCCRVSSDQRAQPVFP